MKLNILVNVEDIYKECDYITVHVPALDSTKGMINKEAFDMMQDGTIILNCARDVLVDEKAIGEALKSGRVKKYVTDFPNPVTAGMRRCNCYFLILVLQQQKQKIIVQLWL